MRHAANLTPGARTSLMVLARQHMRHAMGVREADSPAIDVVLAGGASMFGSNYGRDRLLVDAMAHTGWTPRKEGVYGSA